MLCSLWIRRLHQKATGPELLEEQSEDHQYLKSADACQTRKSKHSDLPLMKTPRHSQGRKSALPPPVLETDKPLQSGFPKAPVEMSLHSAQGRNDCNPPISKTLSQREDAEEALQGSGHTLSWCLDLGLLQGVASVV